MGNHLEEITPQGWRLRYQQQAGWTRALRDYLLASSRVEQARSVLEVGCGPGVILEDLTTRTRASLVGLDIESKALTLAARSVPHAALVHGDARCLPFKSASFDHTLCHFLLLWVDPPQPAVQEMRRVTRPGGSILLLAEPDYGGRIDYPAEFAQLGEWQQDALRRQGADPHTGRQIGAMLHSVGLVDIEIGVLGGQWSGRPSPEEWNSEWAVLRSDLREFVPAHQLDGYQNKDAAAWDRGERILYVPTFYAWGKVP